MSDMDSEMALVRDRGRRLDETLEAQRAYFAADYKRMQLRTPGEQYAAEQSEYNPRTDT